MNEKSVSRIIRVTQAVLLLGLLTLERDAEAQSVLAPPPVFSITPPAVVEYQANNQMEVFSPPETVTHPDEPPLRLGSVGLRPSVFYRLYYATGLPASGTNHVTSTIQEFSPGLLFNIGNHWTLDYTPTWRFYSSDQFRDTLDHNVRLVGGTTYEDWVFGLSQTYNASSAPLVETGTQTDQKTFSTALNASYQFNDKMSLDTAINQNIISADQYQSSSEWAFSDWLNYHFGPRLDVGLGATFGYADVKTGSDTIYEQVQGRINWRATDKFSLQIHGGMEARQFLSTDAGDVLNPIVGGVIQYQPFDFTRLSLNVARTVATSLLTTNSQSQLTENINITGHWNQRLFKKVSLDLEGGYHIVTYVAAGTAATDRKDDYYTFNARLGCPFLKRGTVAVFYQYSDSSSTEPGFTYSTSQVGFEVGYRF
jgi:hypothetical protein